MHIITEEEYIRKAQNGCELVARVTFSDQEMPVFIKIENEHTLNTRIIDYLKGLDRGNFQDIRIDYLFKNESI